jgi:hypothetical protein
LLFSSTSFMSVKSPTNILLHNSATVIVLWYSWKIAELALNYTHLQINVTFISLLYFQRYIWWFKGPLCTSYSKQKRYG